MAGLAGTLAAYVMGKSESRIQKHKRALSVDESLARVQLSTDERKKKDRGTNIVPEHMQEIRQPAKLVDNAVEMLEEVLADQESQREAHKEEYAKLEEKYHKLRKEAARIKQQRDDFREQHNEVQQQYQMLEFKQNSLQHHFDFASTRYKYIVHNTVQPYVQSKSMQWNDQTAETISVVLDRLTADAVEAGTLRDQVRVLQKEMLAKIDKVQVISDEQFSQEFRSLIALIKTLSRTVQFSPDKNVVELSGAPALLRNVDHRHWGGRARKKCLVEAWVWCVLVDLVLQNPFAVFGKEGEYLHILWQRIFGAHHAQKWPAPTALSETWRFTTTEQLANEADLIAVAAGKSKPDTEYKTLELSMFEARSNVYNIIAEYVARISSTTEFALIGPIVDKAFALALQMSSQHFRLQLTYPSVGMVFHRNSMCPLPDPDGEDMEEGTVAFIVHPGLTKWGDSHGKNLDHRFDIVTSLVQLEAAEPSHKKVQAYADVVKHSV